MPERTKPTDLIQAATSVFQAIAVTVGIALAVWQLFVAVTALRTSAEANQHAANSNRIAMVMEANGLLTQVNLTAIEIERMEPEVLESDSTGYTPRERLSLLRLQYVDRMHRLHEAGLLDEPTWAAEKRYITWLANQDGFQDMWTRGEDKPGGALRDQYRSTFRSVVDDAFEG